MKEKLNYKNWKRKKFIKRWDILEVFLWMNEMKIFIWFFVNDFIECLIIELIFVIILKIEILIILL